ncbi:filamentous hemagglutinin N-terminal domain-containing protein [Burkholderia aenigmatica]|uniref:GLUG motif-containing protein n=1 Tax=Burkholderia aenigmatica TaxID=2015348 RepID=UPI001F3DF54C|nr:GLUG motif-containing protein [Burkholderia aenigmatica]UKD14067.1 filamentous hemagglutinin N-terminal domain-containing protein [Burkholderia aenigmatica]
MNKTYALVWNGTQRCWTAVGETARRRGKSASGKRAAVAAVSLLGFAALPAFALPTGEAITSGKADIVRSDDGRTMNINQHTDKLITNWQDFSVAGGERLSFNQPNSQSLALNRVIGATGSRIDGQVSANGRVFLVNPNGVMFGAGAQVNVGGLVASTQNLSDADFLAGNYRFSGTSTQAVTNNGTITAAEGGSVALLGARVANNGTIQAKLGRVALGAGNAFTVNFDGNGLLNLQVDGGAVDAQASNGGLLKADGGEVLMTARAAGSLLDAVVNNTGRIEARGLNTRGGKITLDGGTVQVGGKLDASAGTANAPAGSVVTRGERVNVASNATVDTRAGNGAGTWTIEAANAGVGGDGGSISADALSRNLGTTNVALTNTRHDLTVDGPVTWTSDNALTLTSNNGSVNLNKTLSASGSGAHLLVNAANRINVSDAVKLTGRNAHLELNSKDGHALANDKAVVTLSGANASYRSNGEDYTVLHTLADLRNVDANLDGRYVVGNAIDGMNAGFRSIGGDASFTGKFDGLGNSISRLNITNPYAGTVGLFAVNTGRIANLALQNITTTALTPRYGMPVSIGTLAGWNFGEISNVTAQNVTVAANGVAYVGGLVGSNYSGTIDRASVTGRINADRDAAAIGGLVGENVTVMWSQSQAARISNSRADVRVVAARAAATGGLVGINNGVIEQSSSAGSVVANGNFGNAGGLVGVNQKGGAVTGSSSSVIVTAGHNTNAGGLVGVNDGDIDSSRTDGDVVAGNAGSAGGLVGHNRGRIVDSHANSNVKTGASSQAGGLVGLNEGAIAQATATGRVLAGTDSAAGGLVGANKGSVDRSNASGNITAGVRSNLGGLVGVNQKGGAVTGSSSSIIVTAGHNSNAGGLVGLNDGDIDSSRTDGDVVAGNAGSAGGLVGQNRGRITDSHANSNVKTGASSQAGGLVGLNEGAIAQATATGHVLAGTDSAAGGLVGVNKGSVDRSNASGNITAGVRGHVGGLVGRNTGTVLASNAAGNVKAGAQSDAGGLIGRSDTGRVAESLASGEVEAGDGSAAGGLIGRLGGTVDTSRATGSVRAGAQSQVGGLAGLNAGTITGSSSSGAVSGGRYSNLGGLAGVNLGHIERSSTDSRIAFTSGYEQTYGALAGVNFGTLSGNLASNNSIALVGNNLGMLKD